MTPSTRARTARVVAAVGVLFGIVTLFAGGRVLLGNDPGYIVFRPLLIFNTVMGLAYIAAGILITRSPRMGRNAAGLIFVLNLLVLISIVVIYRGGGNVAVDSLQAMTLRTVVWLLLFAITAWVARPRNPA